MSHETKFVILAVMGLLLIVGCGMRSPARWLLIGAAGYLGGILTN